MASRLLYDICVGTHQHLLQFGDSGREPTILKNGRKRLTITVIPEYLLSVDCTAEQTTARTLIFNSQRSCQIRAPCSVFPFGANTIATRPLMSNHRRDPISPHLRNRCPLPTGASKWNPIEHRMFSEISKNWAAESLNSFETLVNFAADTTTKSGLQIRACRDRQTYEKGQKVTDNEMKTLNLRPGDHLPQWNYSIVPKPDLSAIIPPPSPIARAAVRTPDNAGKM